MRVAHLPYAFRKHERREGLREPFALPQPLLSDEHFSVDGTLIEAWASHKSFKPKQAKTDDDGSNFHGQLRKNDTHQSMTDPEAKLYRKADGREAKLSYLGHALMENRNGLAVGGMVTQAGGTIAKKSQCRRKRIEL
jgi:hypothetical protein